MCFKLCLFYRNQKLQFLSRTDDKTTVKPKPIEKEISASGEEIEVKQSAFNTTDKPIIETTTVSRSIDENFRNHPGSCLNFSDFYHDPNKTYGYFRREFKAISMSKSL